MTVYDRFLTNLKNVGMMRFYPQTFLFHKSAK